MNKTITRPKEEVSVLARGRKHKIYLPNQINKIFERKEEREDVNEEWQSTK